MFVKFPDDLLLGFSSSCYQIEGGWQDHGKGENIWDRHTHTHRDKIKDGTTGDIACDFYNKYKDDVKLMKDLGCQIYRFSLSWSRILPTGMTNEVNMAGVNFYGLLIDELLASNIEPMVTLFHWDLPQPLQDLGGWMNPMMADYFADYAEIAFRNFGHKVKKWITFNEPEAFVVNSYGVGVHPPGVSLTGIADYIAGHNVLKAHAKAYHLYRDNFKKTQGGEVGISLNATWKEPYLPEDEKAAADSLEFQLGWFAHPIFTEEGDYPDVMKKKVAEESKIQGYPRSRLPEFDQFWINHIKGSADFFGLNHYTTLLVSHKNNPPKDDRFVLKTPKKDDHVIYSVDPLWEKANDWLYVFPRGFYKCLRHIKTNYGNPKIYVTENGTLDEGTLEDISRIKYFRNYLTQMLYAIEDGCRVCVYTAWSLTDNFEWDRGYTERFGFYHVDFKDSERKRTPKKSVEFYKSVLQTRKLQISLRII